MKTSRSKGVALTAYCLLLILSSSFLLHGLVQATGRHSAPQVEGTDGGASGRRLLVFWSHSWPSFSWPWTYWTAPTTGTTEIPEAPPMTAPPDVDVLPVPLVPQAEEVQPEEENPAPAWNCGRIAYETLYAGDEDILTLENVEGAGECCAACSKDNSCNIWVYCPEPLGCDDRSGQIIPQGNCDLKIQYDFDFLGGDTPTVIDEGANVEYTSGVIFRPADEIAAPGTPELALEPGFGAVPGLDGNAAGSDSPIQPSAGDTSAESSPPTSGSGGTISAESSTPTSGSSGGSSAESSPAASVESAASNCRVVESGKLYGGTFITTLSGIASADECCERCFQNSECNVFSYCTGDGAGAGCQSAAGTNVLPGRCLLKFQGFPAELATPDVEGEQGTWTSGVALGAK